MTIHHHKKSIRTTANPRTPQARRADELDKGEDSNGTAMGQKMSELRGKIARLHKELERRDTLIDHVIEQLKADKAGPALDALTEFRR